MLLKMTTKIENINLKCNLCDDAHTYELDSQSIIALEAEWKSSDSNENLLSEKPNLNSVYNILIRGPLKINLKKKFWAFYVEPLSQLNGIETEQGIDSICFCLCETVNIIDIHELTVSLKVKDIERRDLNQTNDLRKSDIGWITLLEKTDSSSHYYEIQNFIIYSLIDINIESDIGVTVIVKKNKSKSKIVAVNEWDFHRNLWYLFEEELTKEQELKYGIQHSV